MNSNNKTNFQDGKNNGNTNQIKVKKEHLI